MSRNYGIVSGNERGQRIMVKFEGGQDQLDRVRLKISLMECSDKILLDSKEDEARIESFF